MPEKQQSTGFLIERSENAIGFRRPLSIRLLTGMLTVLFTFNTGIMAFATIAVITNTRRFDGIALAVTALFTVVFAGAALFSATFAAPCEMRFDLRTRTYRYRHGLPFVSATAEGQFSDFDYLYARTWISYRYGSRTPDSRIYLVWKNAPKLFGVVPQPEFLLQMLSDTEQIEREASDYARLLGVPLEPKRRDRASGRLATPVPQPRVMEVRSAVGTFEGPGPSTPVAVGKVVSSEGPVVDVQFNPADVPPIFNAITVSDPVRKLTAVGTVAQHLTNGVVRCVLLTGEEGMTPGVEATDTGGPDARSLPADVLRRAMTVMGRDRSAESTLLETGMKAVDLLCPIPRGGKIGIFSEWGVGAAVLIPELLHLLQNRPGGLSIFTFLQIPADASRYRETVGELPIRSGERATIYLPVQNPDDPALRTQLDMLDVSIHLTRRLGKQGFYPPIDPETSRSVMLDRYQVGPDHIQTADAVRKILRRAQEFQPAIEASGLDSLPASDRLLVSRARKIERFLTQPFFVAEPYTGKPGKSVPIAETIRRCRAILDGAHDELPEQRFYMIGELE